MDRAKVTDLYFLEARSKLIDLAAFLDRVERSSGADDYRLQAFRRALGALAQRADEAVGGGTARTRAEEALLAFSDPTLDPLSAADDKAARGAWHPDENL